MGANIDMVDNDLLQVDLITSGANNIHNWDISRDAALADDTEIGSVRFRSFDAGSVLENYAFITGRMESDVVASEDGSLFLGVALAGNHATNFISLNDASDGVIKFLRDLNLDNNNITNVEDIEIQTPTAATVANLLGVDATPDIFRINVATNIDFEIASNAINKARLDVSAQEFQFNLDIVRFQERLNIQDVTVNPPTPPAGQATLFLFESAGAQTLRVKFDNGTVKDIANDV